MKKKLFLTNLEIENILNKAKIRASAQRIAICRYVLCEASHPTAEEIKAWADKNFLKVSLATVYNTLNLLVKNKILKEYNFGPLEKQIFDNNTDPHFHFLDEESGEILDISPKDLEIKNNLPKNYKINSLNLLITGKVEKT